MSNRALFDSRGMSFREGAAWVVIWLGLDVLVAYLWDSPWNFWEQSLVTVGTGAIAYGLVFGLARWWRRKAERQVR